MKELQQKIKSIIKEAGGTWGIVMEDLDGQKSWQMNKEEPFYAASVIKLPIMGTVFSLADRGEFVLSDTLELKREYIVGGFGVLQHMTPGMKLSIYDLLTLMIIQSDNIATNMLLDLVGIEEVEKVLETLGMKNSHIYHKMMVKPVGVPINVITAADISSLLYKWVNGNFESLGVCKQMIGIMKKQQVRGNLPAYLPEAALNYVGGNLPWVVANKTGSGQNLHHDVGVFYVEDRTMLVTTLSKGCNFIKGSTAMAQIGKEVYHYMKQTRSGD